MGINKLYNHARKLAIGTALALSLTGLESIAQDEKLLIRDSTDPPNSFELKVINAKPGTYVLQSIDSFTPGENQGHYWVNLQTNYCSGTNLSFVVPNRGSNKFFRVSIPVTNSAASATYTTNNIVKK